MIPVGNVSGEIEIIVEDKDGNVIKHIKKPMDSFVKNMKEIMLLSTNRSAYLTDRNGTLVTVTLKSASDDHFYDADALAPEGDSNYGIIVGTGTAAFSVADYDLASPISHGTGSGQLSHGAVSVPETGDDYVTFQRSFDNNSGADITVNEIGVATMIKRDHSGTIETYYVLLARDVITATTVPNGGRLTVKYTFRINPS